MLLFVLALQKLQEDRQRFQRIDDGQQRRKHADEESQFLTHSQSAKSDRLDALALLLLLELLDLLILPLNLRLLCGQLLLHSLVLLLPRLDRKSTRLNSSHLGISYAVFCLK